MGSIWSFYVLFIDNSISFIFFYIITFKQLKNGINQMKIIRELKFSLGVFTLLSWISLSFALIGAVLFSQLPMERQFFYRIGISFSTLMYSSSLIFIFNLPKIISIDLIDKKSGNEGISKRESLVCYSNTVLETTKITRKVSPNPKGFYTTSIIQPYKNPIATPPYPISIIHQPIPYKTPLQSPTISNTTERCHSTQSQSTIQSLQNSKISSITSKDIQTNLPLVRVNSPFTIPNPIQLNHDSDSIVIPPRIESRFF
ncbi:hypothetical protein HDV02_004080 [Globomyces sp. JEL0801]|nr:hypothetical protein HDV02_004080 [Globomyces sp. JEL0801]